MFYLKLMAYTLQFKEILSLILLIVWIRGFESINIRLCSRVGHAVESVRLVLGSWYLEMSVRGLLVAGYRLCSVCDDHCTVPQTVCTFFSINFALTALKFHAYTLLNMEKNKAHSFSKIAADQTAPRSGNTGRKFGRWKSVKEVKVSCAKEVILVVDILPHFLSVPFSSPKHVALILLRSQYSVFIFQLKHVFVVV